MFKRLLVPLDGSEIAEQALPVAARIAHNTGCEVMLLQVIDVTAFSYGLVYGYATLPPTIGQQSHISEVIETSLRGVRNYLSELATSPMFDGIPIEIYTPFGSVSPTILATAESEQIDCIIMTNRGNTGMARWILGSVAEHILQHTAIPVLLLRGGTSLAGRTPASETEPDTISTVPERPASALVALDGTIDAKVALLPAAYLISALATPGRGKLHLLRIVKPGNTEKEQQQSVNKAESYLQLVTDQLREQLAAEDSATNVDISWSVIVAPDVVAAIATAAGDRTAVQDKGQLANYDIIVLATNDRSGLQRWLMGSVTKGILTESRLPLLAVKATIEKPGHPMQEPQKDLPQVQAGAAYPKRYIMAVIDSVDIARETIKALTAAGVPTGHIRFFEHHETVDHIEHTGKTRSLRSRIVDILQTITSDDAEHVMIYVEEAIRGHAILNIYVPEDEQIERVREILLANQAHTIKYFRRWSVSALHG